MSNLSSRMPSEFTLTPISDLEFKKLSELAMSIAGLTFPDGKQTLVQTRVAKRLRALGLQIVLDNFGADQASLSLLTPLQAKVVKCSSQSFERLLASQSANSRRDVLAAINHAARAFGITISAKDVETSEQSELFRDAGICMQQGAYLAGVLNVEDTGKYLRGGFQAASDLALKAS